MNESSKKKTPRAAGAAYWLEHNPKKQEDSNLTILKFQGEHRWLSNFWLCPVVLDGSSYPSVENAYQAAKTILLEERAPFLSCSPGQAKRLGKSVSLREDWEEVKVPTMRLLLGQKFARDTELGEKLIATGSAELIEGNYWGDIFWGVDLRTNIGKNLLGKLLMEQRAFISTPTGSNLREYIRRMERSLALFYKAGTALEKGESEEQVRTLLKVALRDVRMNQLPIRNV